jgi:hypothetical protein
LEYMLILPAADVRKALPMAQTIAAMKSAYAALSSGKAEVPLRSRLSIPPHEAVSLFMPVYLEDSSGEALAVKIVSLFPNNPERGLPLIQAAVLVLEADTGRPLALMEGGTLTAIRTGAASAQPQTCSPALTAGGCHFWGRVSRAAHNSKRCAPYARSRLPGFSTRKRSAQAFIHELAGQGPIPADLRAPATLNRPLQKLRHHLHRHHVVHSRFH